MGPNRKGRPQRVFCYRDGDEIRGLTIEENEICRINVNLLIALGEVALALSAVPAGVGVCYKTMCIDGERLEAIHMPGVHRRWKQVTWEGDRGVLLQSKG